MILNEAKQSAGSSPNVSGDAGLGALIGSTDDLQSAISSPSGLWPRELKYLIGGALGAPTVPTPLRKVRANGESSSSGPIAEAITCTGKRGSAKASR